MPRPPTVGPTDGELEILRVLWDKGPSTVRQVHESLKGKKAPGYTSTLKLMQIMTEKGLVLRDEWDRTHIYRPKQTEERTQRILARHLLRRAFRGSTHKLVMHALSASKASPRELSQIRKLLEELEGRGT